MKTTTGNILTSLAALLLLLPATGCGSSANDAPDVPGNGSTTVLPGSLRAGFSITVSDTKAHAGTRAPQTPAGGYDDGEGYENYIDIENGNFRFYFFDENSTLVAPITIDAIFPTSQTATSKTYQVDGYVPRNLAGRRLKVVALANWPGYPADTELTPGVTTIASLCGRQYDYSPAGMLPSASNPIPLFGIGKEQTLVFDALDHADLGKIHLLRAYAKIEVIAHSDSPAPIEWAKVVRYNSKGYCAPAGVNNESDYVHNDYDKDYVNTPHIPDGCENAGELDMKWNETTRSFIAYVPEYRNLTVQGTARPAGERTLLRVQFREPENVKYDTDTVEFKDYAAADGAHFDVLRNYWYRFTVSKFLLKPIVDVMPYNGVTLTPDFGFDDLYPGGRASN